MSEVKTAAAYVRVSTEEQALRGYSITAQKEAIRKYAIENGYRIVAEYADEGVSGKKPYRKRPALSRFMADIQSGLKVDVLLFCKLDRFYRSVKLYYQAIEVMEKHGVAWKAIQDDYETETATGRLKVNMMLAIAENEADRTSERIKAVNESKVAHGQAVFSSMPIGFRREGQRILIDPARVDVARDLFRVYEEQHSSIAAIRYIQETYGISILPQMIYRMLRNPLYKGQYRDNPNYCEAIIQPEDFNRVQELLKSRACRHNQTGRVYIFAGLIRCEQCGASMTGAYRSYKDREFRYYRCAAHIIYQRCGNGLQLREDRLENWLLLNIGSELERQRLDAESKRTGKKKRDGPDRASVMKKLERLKNLYVNELIGLEEYRADYEKYAGQLAEMEEQEANREKVPDFQKIAEQIDGIEDFYQSLAPLERQAFWRGILLEIQSGGDGSIQIFFR